MVKKAAKKTAGAAAKRKAVATATMREVIIQTIEESGKSVNSIADASGVSQSSLSRFIRGERDLLLDAASKVAKELGLKLVKDDSAG